MNTCLFRIGSVLARISFVPYKYVPIYMCIFKDTYYIRIRIYAQQLKYMIYLWLKSTWKYIMVEFLLSIRVSFWQVKVGRMPRRCAATISYQSHCQKVGWKTEKLELLSMSIKSCLPVPAGGPTENISPSTKYYRKVPKWNQKIKIITILGQCHQYWFFLPVSMPKFVK